MFKLWDSFWSYISITIKSHSFNWDGIILWWLKCVMVIVGRLYLQILGQGLKSLFLVSKTSSLILLFKNSQDAMIANVFHDKSLYKLILLKDSMWGFPFYRNKFCFINDSFDLEAEPTFVLGSCGYTDGPQVMFD